MTNLHLKLKNNTLMQSRKNAQRHDNHVYILPNIIQNKTFQCTHLYSFFSYPIHSRSPPKISLLLTSIKKTKSDALRSILSAIAYLLIKKLKNTTDLARLIYTVFKLGRCLLRLLGMLMAWKMCSQFLFRN